MKLGLIARADSRGLGVQTKAFYDHMHPVKTLVVNCPSAKPLPVRRDWYPDAAWIEGWPTPQDFERFFTDLDVVYTAETIYDHLNQNYAYTLAKRMGVKVVNHTNPEFCDAFRHPTWPRPDLYAAPSTWMWDRLPDPKVLLPVPVATEHFAPQTATEARNFLHVVGRPAIHDRAGTADLLRALHYVRSEMTVTITCQEIGYVEQLVRNNGGLPDNISLTVADGDVDNYWDLYTGHHVLASPRRFGGLSLPMQEACAAGMPVIATAVIPNTSWLPLDWLVPADHCGSFNAHTRVDLYSVKHQALAFKIDQFARDAAFYRDASARALGIAKRLSWSELIPLYHKVLSTS